MLATQYTDCVVSIVIAGLTGRACGSVPLASITREHHIPHVIISERSKFKIPWMASDAYHFRTIIRSKNRKSNHHESGTVIHTHFKLSEAKTELVSPLNLFSHNLLRSVDGRIILPFAVQKPRSFLIFLTLFVRKSYWLYLQNRSRISLLFPTFSGPNHDVLFVLVLALLYSLFPPWGLLFENCSEPPSD